MHVVYWPRWLEQRGLSDVDISLLLSCAIWTRTIAGPLWARRADRLGRHLRVLRGLVPIALLACALFAAGHSFWVLLAPTLLLAASFPPMIALIDALTMRAIGESDGRLEYGRIRLWGSSAFLLTVVLVGLLFDAWGGPQLALPLLAIGFVLTFFATRGLPAPKRPRELPATPVKDLLKRNDFVLVLVAVALIQGSHICYYSFSAIHWQRAGHSGFVIGSLWAEGVIAEIILFWFARRVSLRPAFLMLLGAIAASLRWTVLAQTTALPALVAVQWFHAATFGCTHLAAIRWIERHVAPERIASAQGLVAATAAGVVPGLALPIVGGLFDRDPTHAYLAMTGMAAVAIVLALRIAVRPTATGTGLAHPRA